jgi:acyl-CoA-binding protein
MPCSSPGLKAGVISEEQVIRLAKEVAYLGHAPADGHTNPFDFVAKFKHEAWTKLKGLPKEETMQQYTALVARFK